MDEAEGDMVEAAIQESLRATRSTVKTGGSPSKFVSLSDAEVLSVSDLSEASDSEDEQPLTKKGKAVAKGKGKGKATGSADSTTVWEAPKIMDLTELKKQKRLARLAKASGRSGYKQQEKAMAKELGRALIQVCFASHRYASHSSFHLSQQSEKNVIRLHKEHPELKDVWKDLETAVKPIAPEKAPQPKNLKVTLLPFQQESVFWLRKQEASVWKGGLLAVGSVSFVHAQSALTCFVRMRWAWARPSRLLLSWFPMARSPI
jgi:DNA repair protein RAD16